MTPIAVLRSVIDNGMPEYLDGPPSHSDMHLAITRILGLPTCAHSIVLNQMEHISEHVEIERAILDDADRYGIPVDQPPPFAVWQGHGEHHAWQIKATAQLLTIPPQRHNIEIKSY